MGSPALKARDLRVPEPERPAGDLSTKVFEDLKKDEKDLLLKQVAIRLGLIKSS